MNEIFSQQVEMPLIEKVPLRAGHPGQQKQQQPPVALQLRVPPLPYYDGNEEDDHPFIVLTETKFSLRCIPVWARYSPHRTRVEKKKAHAIMLSP